MTKISYKTPDAELIAINVRDLLLYSGVRNMEDNEVFFENLDGDN